MPVSEATFQQVALEDDQQTWELVCGRLQAKPGMTARHENTGRRLVRRFNAQLPEEEFSVGQDSPNLRVPGGNYRVPDVCVIPVAYIERRQREFPLALEMYDEPMPLVVEIWSPSTGDYDVDTKLIEYQRRGDLEICRIHPYERTLIAWRRQPDGTYSESLYTGGLVQPAFLPDVTIDLDSLFG
jgi:Uma2 family endonuclease